MLINERTRAFVKEHAEADVRRLALTGTKDPEVDMTVALQQIAGRQTAQRKLPTWAATEGIVYPPHLNMEQCSSELTARYKATLAGHGDTFADLTGGFGVDFYWMSQGFAHRHYVEQHAELCAIAESNFHQLGLACSVYCGLSAAGLEHLDHADLVYLDPARRNEQGGRTYGIEDCTPNVLELLPLLLEKSDRIMLKLSPMLDWRKAVSDLKQVKEVHIVSVDNECKELLMVLAKREGQQDGASCLVSCVNLLTKGGMQEFSFTHPTPSGDTRITRCPDPLPTHLFEPHASIMKAGCFTALEQAYPVCQVAPHSHLFLSSQPIASFPGRRFQIMAVTPVDQKAVRRCLQKLAETEKIPMERANITVRNFPLTVEQLRKKLKLKDGGSLYIFATTAADGQHQLFICRKIG